MKRLQLFLLVILTSNTLFFAQNVGINTTSPHTSAALDITATNKGMLVPRLTTTQRTNISSPATGLLVFDTSLNQFYFYNGTAWAAIPLSNWAKIQDTDDNTSVQVERTANDDKIRFMIGGTDRFSMTGARFEVHGTGASTFLGANAGAKDDLSNNQNTFVGYYVGSETTTGMDNSAFGRSALEMNTTGDNNTALGYVTLSTLTTGSGNTVVGAFAGQYATGSNNVFLGMGAGRNETGNNKLYIDNNSTATPLIYGDFSTNTLTVNGSMGIGTTTPTQAKFVVNGSASNTLSYGYLNSSGATGTFSNGTNDYSIYASDRIAATEFNAFSDRRIKRILRGSNSAEDLATLMKIKVTDYKLIDSIAKGNATIKKVIAQEVAEVYPNAVSKMTDFIPNIYQLAKIENGFIAIKNHNLMVGDKVKLIFDNKQEVIKVLRTHSNGFYTEGVPDGDVFVYGKEVNDFHTVDYEALSTLNISATQELVKQINDLKTQNASMKVDIETLKAAVFKKVD
jgi:hypothetical protein